jgi:multidrug efflux pump subunit AcrA (membrane-fusion protein)
MKKTVLITALVVVLTSLALMVFVRLTSRKVSHEMNFAEAKKGTFEIAVSNTGELVAENSIDIKGPNIVQNRNFRVAPIKIVDLVPEGTVVKKGDYIATLDRSNFNNTLKDELDILKTNQTELEMKILDTALVMSNLRDEIKNQHFVVEEASVNLDQSKYEPPAIQRQAALELDKARRLLIQKAKLYSLRSSQTMAEIKTLRSQVNNQSNKVKDLQAILENFTITAPSDGMVIYKKDRLGNKIKAGSMVNPFDPAVATLPDLSSMLSKIYVSEIDVNKVKKGQPVQLTIDAFQGKSYKGKVAIIANIGEQLANSDSKVFEVLVKIDGSDLMLRPSMTTSNKVITKSFNDVVYVPSESVQAGTDSITFVYTKDGKRQIVILGESDDKNIIIEKGLNSGTPVWLSTPMNPDKFMIAGSDLIPVIREREKARKLEMQNMSRENVLLTHSETKTFSAGSGGSSSGSSGTAGVN